MSESSHPPVEALLNDLFNGYTTSIRKKALLELTGLSASEKQQAATNVVGHLAKEPDGSTRGWCISALTMLDAARASDAAIRHLGSLEKSEWARYWSAIGLAKLHPSGFERHLQQAANDPSEMVKAVCFRLLIENKIESDQNFTSLLNLARDPKEVGDRWAAFKVLRRNAGSGPLPQVVEKRFLPILEEHLVDNSEPQKVQRQAALALGDMECEWREAIAVLDRALDVNRSDMVKHACIEALAAIGKPEVKGPLTTALRDKSSDVRSSAADVLKQVLGPTAAIHYLIDEHVIKDDQVRSEYIEALRQIDNTAALKILSTYLGTSDRKTDVRIRNLLALLGRDEITFTLHDERTEVAKRYRENLAEVDKQISGPIRGLIHQVSFNSTIGMFMQIAIFIAGVVLLLYSLSSRVFSSSATGTEQGIGIGGAIIGLLLMLVVFYRGPINNIRRNVTNLIQVYVVFLGYLRQLNQIDAAFSQQLLNSPDLDFKKIEESITQIQSSVEQTLGEMATHFSNE